ncbi:DUF2218 domain-containing protein [Shinella sp. BYT-45]|uniref:DUF2218 domain-containing protein n=1 Tax=Shinella sp. BYT-45 TaxID=3377377 RepID=UPI00397F0F80
MHESTAYLQTANGRKYLVQLCKHFAHKIEVSYSQSHGDCRFPCGAAVLEADADGLRMAVTAGDEDGLARTQSIIETHLVRFAFREKLEALDWRRQDKAA